VPKKPINTPSSSPDQNCTSEPPSIGGELGGPKITKYNGRGFGCHFFEGGSSRRLVNASHISFYINPSQFQVKLDLGLHDCVWRERERMVFAIQSNKVIIPTFRLLGSLCSFHYIHVSSIINFIIYASK